MSDNVPFGYCHCGCGEKTTISKQTSTQHGRVKGQPTKYLAGHGPRPKPIDYVIDPDSGCWLWQRYIDKYGYGRIRPTENGTALAHKAYYIRHHGFVPDGRDVTQSCGNRACVNPTHLTLAPTREEEFWSHVDKSSASDCWTWTGTDNSRGYGVFLYKGETWMAHRLAWFLVNGSVPDGLCALHRCDNPSCVSPAHIFWGTKADNAQDMVEKRRSLTGERNHKARLTVEDVSEIRRLYATGQYSQTRLAGMFSINQAHVSNIVRRKEWRHV